MAEVDPIDFDPTTEEGREDINEEIDRDTDFLLPRENETGESWIQRINTKFKSGADYAIDRLTSIFKTRNPGKAVPEYMELQNMDEIKERLENQDEAVEEIKRKYPDADTSNIISTLDDFGNVIVKLKRKGAKEYFFTDPKLPKTIKDFLGKSVEDKVEEIDARNNTLQEEEQRNIEQINRNNEERSGASAERTRAIDRANESLEERNSQINEERTENNIEAENLEERMSLRDRIKRIFKKYGFTVVSVAIAVSTVIGVIISQLKNGLSSVAKGVGNGLKTLGKKLGQILPGMIGAIASFIFKTAGEVVSFVAEHAWLLIVAVVVFVVEKMKS